MMLVALSQVKLRQGHAERVVPLLQQNIELSTRYRGCVYSLIATDNQQEDEILIYTLWQDQQSYEEAMKAVKKDPKATKIMLKLLPHLLKEPNVNTYRLVGIWKG